MVNKARPTGGLGKLYDEVAAYSVNPVSEIERIANQALSDSAIDHRSYTVLQYRVPLPGYERETLKQVGTKLGDKTREWPRRLEFIIYTALQIYLPEEARESIEEPDIEEAVTEPIQQMLTIRQVSEWLGIHINTVRRLSNSGVITVYRIGIRRDRRFKKEDIENYLESVRS